MADLNTQTLSEVFAQYMPTTPVPLIRYVGVDNTGTPITKRYVANYEDITSGGEVFSKAAFSITLGSDESDNVPTVNLVYDSGDRQLISELREFDEAPDVFFSVVVAERPDEVQIPEIEFRTKEWTIKDTTVNITLETEPVLNEPIVGDIVSPQIFPLLWSNVVVN